MEEEVPAALKNAAIAQIVSGLVSWFIMSNVMCMAGVTICGILTVFLGGIGGICGYAAYLLVPIGWIEIGSGVYGLMNPKEGAKIMKYVSYLEMGALLFGGISTCIMGFVVSSMLSKDEVVAYLES